METTALPHVAAAQARDSQVRRRFSARDFFLARRPRYPFERIDQPGDTRVRHCGPGQWCDRDGVVTREQSHVLVIWHELTGRHEADIEAIRSAYRSRFDQESVMRVAGQSCVSF